MVTRADILLVRSLSDRRSRLAEGLFVAEGAKLVGEIAASGMRLRKVYATEAAFTAEAAFTTGTPASAALPVVETVSAKEMERMSHLKTPTGVLALVEIPGHGLPTPGQGLVLALDGVQDPGNLGTIIRTADWFGIGDVVCSPLSADCFNPKVVQATMGAITRVRVHYTDLEEWLTGADCPVYGTFLEGADIYRTDLTPGGVIVMGSEGRGISPVIAALVTHKLFIPPFAAGATSESLNVAVATAIICSEFRRR